MLFCISFWPVDHRVLSCKPSEPHKSQKQYLVGHLVLSFVKLLSWVPEAVSSKQWQSGSKCVQSSCTTMAYGAQCISSLVNYYPGGGGVLLNFGFFRLWGPFGGGFKKFCPYDGGFFLGSPGGALWFGAHKKEKISRGKTPPPPGVEET